MPDKVRLLHLDEVAAELTPFIFLFFKRIEVDFDEPLVRLIPLFGVPDEVRLLSEVDSDTPSSELEDVLESSELSLLSLLINFIMWRGILYFVPKRALYFWIRKYLSTVRR